MPDPAKKKRTRKSTAPAAAVAVVERAEVPVEPWWEEAPQEQGPIASSEVEPTIAPEPTAAIYQEKGIENLLRGDDFMNQMVNAMTQSKVMDSLVEDIADKLKDALESNPEFRHRLVSAVVSTETFKRKLVRNMAEISG